MDHERAAMLSQVKREIEDRQRATERQREVEVSVMFIKRSSADDPFEELVWLPEVPQIGSKLNVWIPPLYEGGSGESAWVEVNDVCYCTWAPERIEVWISCEDHDDEDVERIFMALKENSQP